MTNNTKNRQWQVDSFAVIERCNTSSSKETIPVNACVGSGKTRVANYALGDFIRKNKDKSTFQMFVTPRIKLCKQQAESISKDIAEMFGMADGVDYDIIRRDCSVDNGVKFNPKGHTYSPHIILVICDESLWGKDEKIEKDFGVRFQSYLTAFENMQLEGRLFGNAVFDEAHNFTNNHEQIFGETA